MLLAHVGQDGERRVEDAPEHDIHRLAEVVVVHRLERADLEDAGVVHENVRRAEAAGDELDELLDL